jgi:hypothetical protein
MEPERIIITPIDDAPASAAYVPVRPAMPVRPVIPVRPAQQGVKIFGLPWWVVVGGGVLLVALLRR